MDVINLIVSNNIKLIRKDKNLSLDELARLSGVSKSMLAQIERGSGNPSLSTLWKIANGMKVPFDALVTRPKAPYEIVQLSDIDPVLGDGGNIRNYAIFPDDENRRFSIYYIEVESGCGWQSEPHLRGTVEFVTVFSGTLEIIQGEEHTFQIEKGGSIRFEADLVHSYRNAGEEPLVFYNVLYNPGS
ncbi:MAG: helix-turn-helix domain-containing protein [Lachnospiraceae bacterium]|nr:helix-turn-helix domain-containing protein [Lachnospiraceae bacterium]